MTPEALALKCIDVIQQQPDVPFIVVIGKLDNKGWPRGKCIGSDSRGRFYSYDAYELLGRLVAYRVVYVEALRAGGATLEVLKAPPSSGVRVLAHDATLKMLKVANKITKKMLSESE